MMVKEIAWAIVLSTLITLLIAVFVWLAVSFIYADLVPFYSGYTWGSQIGRTMVVCVFLMTLSAALLSDG